MTGDLHHVYTFQYHSRFGDAGSEREVCWVGRPSAEDPACPQPHEVSGLRWIAPRSTRRGDGGAAAGLHPWFLMEWPEVRERYPRSLP